MTVLAAVSGGLDSVAMLWALLRAGETVHVHHVSLRTRTRRWQAEDAAMAAVAAWLRGEGMAFGYSESAARPVGCDIAVVSRECGRMCRETGLAPAALARGSAPHDDRSRGILIRRREAEREWVRWWPAGAAPPITRPIGHMTRAEMWALLPPALAALTASCRRPRVEAGIYRFCGQCPPCRQMKAADIPLERTLRETA